MRRIADALESSGCKLVDAGIIGGPLRVRDFAGGVNPGWRRQVPAPCNATEEIFGWIRTVGNFRRTRYRGVERTSFAAYLVGAAYNLLRIAKLCPSG